MLQQTVVCRAADRSCGYEARMRTYDLVADLPLRIEEYALEGLEQHVSSDFTRRSTVIRLRGRGEEGVGEDVIYDSVDQKAALEAGASLQLQGSWTLRTFAEHLAGLELFPREPQEQVSRLYRTWAYESAALDLALRQAGEPLHAVLDREPQPLTFVVSLRLGDPPSLQRLTSRLERYPSLRFKLDPTSDWDAKLIDGVAETGAVELLDFKGHYDGSIMEQPPDPDLYRRVVDAVGDADGVWFEDPKLTPEIDELLAPYRSRITWDANIHSIADIEALSFRPQMVNFKPSRIGSLERLLDAYDYVEANGIGAYGGGMYELGPGRGQIQYLASLFHPDAPNDTSPEGFLRADVPEGLPDGPLDPAPAQIGFRWGE
jgi:L-alanine-DL-glutamate epimerase-like enolase superfamily enzyme